MSFVKWLAQFFRDDLELVRQRRQEIDELKIEIEDLQHELSMLRKEGST